MSNQVQLLTTGAFLQSVANDLISNNALQVSMSFFLLRDGPQFNVIFPGLVRNLQRGGSLHIKLDSVFSGTFQDALSGINLRPWRHGQTVNGGEIIAQTKDKLKILEDLGAKVTFVRKPGLLGKIIPTYGRDHRKNITIKDEKGELLVVYTGSTNIHDVNPISEQTKPIEEWRDSNDFMLRIVDPELAKNFVYTSSLYDYDLPQDNIEIPSNLGTVYLDVGNGSSLIRRRLSGLIKSVGQNDEVILASQVTPDPFMAFILRRASNRGANVTLILPNENHPQMTRQPYKIAHTTTKAILKFSTVQIEYMDEIKWFTHSKSIYIKKSEKEFAFSGAENFAVLQGILLHTVDDGIITEDPVIVNQIKKHLDYLVYGV